MADAITAAGELEPAACRQAAAERFSLDRMISRYFETYRRIAEQTATPARLSG
jgi:hypothetical protein